MTIEPHAAEDHQLSPPSPLGAARARYFDCYDDAPVGHLTIGHNGLILQANATAADMFDVPREELVSQPLVHLIHADDADRFRHFATVLTRTGSRQSGEVRMGSRNGRAVCAHVSLTAIVHSAPADTAWAPAESAFHLVVHDLTTRNASDAGQHDIEARYRRIVETAEEGIWTIDKESRTDFVNPKMARMLGYTVDDMIGRLLHEFMDEAGRDIADANLKRRQQGIAEQHEFKFQRHDGTDLWTLLVTNPITSPTGEYLGALAMITDITERKQAERALHESEEKFRTLFESAGDAIFIMAGRDLVECNARALAIFGCHSRDQFAGAPPHQFSPPQQPNGQDSLTAAREKIDAAIAGRPQSFEWTHCRLDGTPFPAEVTLNAVTVGGTVLHQAIVRDITERQQAQTERERLERRMQETQKLESLGVLAGGVAHDFNNILTAIIGNASLAKLDAAPGSELHDYLDSISVGSQRAAELCQQMLAYSGRGRFVVQRIDISQLVAETAQILKLSISKKAMLQLGLETALPPVEGDATQLRQVLMNLVINASEALGDQHGNIRLTTGLMHADREYLRDARLAEEQPEGDYVFMEVADTGSGMSGDTQSKIFDPFFTTKFLGRGLGLAAVLGIVRGHGGTLKIKSAPDRGTTFRLLFPAVAGLSDVPATPAPPGDDWQGHGEILVVDDEEDVRSVASKMLPLLGFAVTLVPDGRAAVDLCRADPARFALVLLDLTMPHMGGEETFLELHRLRASLPVVLMSGYSEQESLIRFPDEAPASFLQKPFDLAALRAVLRVAIH